MNTYIIPILLGVRILLSLALFPIMLLTILFSNVNQSNIVYQVIGNVIVLLLSLMVYKFVYGRLKISFNDDSIDFEWQKNLYLKIKKRQSK